MEAASAHCPRDIPAAAGAEPLGGGRRASMRWTTGRPNVLVVSVRVLVLMVGLVMPRWRLPRLQPRTGMGGGGGAGSRQT